MDIKGTVIKLELETPMTLIQKPNVGLENSNQKDHIVEVHSENQALLRKPKNVYKQSFRCEICEKYFKLKSQMQRHVKKVHEKASETKCDLCDKTFYDASSLLYILTVHKKVKNVQCKICNISFPLKGTLKRHILIVHEKIKDFQCVTCNKSFSMKRDLERHVSNVHEMRKDFKCESCEKTFSQKGHLNRHTSSVHEGIKSLL